MSSIIREIWADFDREMRCERDNIVKNTRIMRFFYSNWEITSEKRVILKWVDQNVPFKIAESNGEVEDRIDAYRLRYLVFERKPAEC